MVSNHGIMASGTKITILAKYFKSLVNYASGKFFQLFNYGVDIIAGDVEGPVDLLGLLSESVS